MRRYYTKLSPRHKYLTENNFEKAKELAAWKKTMREEWDNIEVLNYSFEKTKDNVYRSGQDYTAEIALNVNKIPRENVGVEFIITRMNKQGEHRFVASEELKLISCKSGKCLYRTHLVPEKAGSFFYGYESIQNTRIFRISRISTCSGGLIKYQLLSLWLLF